MRTVTKLLMTMLLAFGLTTQASAKHHGGEHQGKHGFNPEHMIQKMTKKLSLNEQQASYLEQVVNKMAEHHADKQHGPMPISPEQAQSLLAKEAFDQAQALQLVEQHITVMRQHSSEMIPLVAQFTDSLNAEQREKLAKWYAKRGHKMSRHKGGKKGKRHHDNADMMYDDNGDDSNYSNYSNEKKQ